MYDPLNRLIQIDRTVNNVASAETIAYNPQGNITHKTGVGDYYYGGNASCAADKKPGSKSRGQVFHYHINPAILRHGASLTT